MKFDLTKKPFISFLPHAATEIDRAHSIIFQDVSKQKNADCGALWSDDVMYAIAREIQ